MRFLGATLWTVFEFAIETPEGPVSGAACAMKVATNLLNDYALIRTVEESAEPDTWRDKQGRELQAQDTLRIHQAQRAWLQNKLSGNACSKQCNVYRAGNKIFFRALDEYRGYAVVVPDATFGTSPAQASFGIIDATVT